MWEDVDRARREIKSHLRPLGKESVLERAVTHREQGVPLPVNLVLGRGSQIGGPSYPPGKWPAGSSDTGGWSESDRLRSHDHGHGLSRLKSRLPKRNFQRPSSDVDREAIRGNGPHLSLQKVHPP